MTSFLDMIAPYATHENFTIVYLYFCRKNCTALPNHVDKYSFSSFKEGIIECVPNAKTRHDLGKKSKTSLHTHFIRKFGKNNTPTGKRYREAQHNFIASLAAYNVFCYILQVKDRHNGNIMFDDKGHIVHIGKELNGGCILQVKCRDDFFQKQILTLIFRFIFRLWVSVRELTWRGLF